MIIKETIEEILITKAESLETKNKKSFGIIWHEHHCGYGGTFYKNYIDYFISYAEMFAEDFHIDFDEDKEEDIEKLKSMINTFNEETFKEMILDEIDRCGSDIIVEAGSDEELDEIVDKLNKDDKWTYDDIQACYGGSID